MNGFLVMRPEDLAQCIEEAFGSVECPSLEEMAAADCSIEDEFIYAVESNTWQELRPLRHFVGDGGEIVLLSAKAYQYYLPAYLVALVDEPAEEFYLNGVLDSLWYESWLPSGGSLVRDFFDPRKGLDETLHEIETQMPHLTDQEKKTAAETRVSNARRLADLKEITGHDLLDRSYLRVLWEERMPLLTDQQNKCIAQLLVHILERTKDPFDAPRIQTMLDKYWSAFLVRPETDDGT